MLLRSIYLQYFRSYTQQKFDFSDTLTVVIGKNTAGKTNLSEAIHLLSIGTSFKTHKDTDMIAFGQEVGRVQGLLFDGEEKIKIEVVIASPQITSGQNGRFMKKLLINEVAKSRKSLQGLLPLVLFRPEELDIIIAGPSLRREFLDEVLEQVDRTYLAAKLTYERSLRQRNALLRVAQEKGIKNDEQFVYWDNLLIESGQVIHQKREEFLNFSNKSVKDIFPLQVVYDHSVISRERLDHYREAEIASGVTLVGPHRDDFFVTMEIERPSSSLWEEKDIRSFGSRGQQRLAVLQLKMLQINYIQKKLLQSPLLVLDDIFSELDNSHIQLVLDKVKGMQIILTTTHKEFIPQNVIEKAAVIELNLS